MQRDLIILSSSPAQPLFDDENREHSYKPSSNSISYHSAIDKHLKSGSDASVMLQNAEADFRLASSLLPEKNHERAMEDVLTIAAEVHEKENATNSAGTAEKKKRTRRKKDDSNATGQTKKREADKTATPDGGRSRKTVRKGKTTGRVSAYFAPGKDQENSDGKLADEAVDRAGSPPPRRRISWTPPRTDRTSLASDEGFVQISEFEYKTAQAKSSGTNQSTFTIGRKIEVCNIHTSRKYGY